MTFSALDSFTPTEGQLYVIGTAVTAASNFLVLNSSLNEDRSRQYGTLVLQVYAPNPVDEFATAFTRVLYTRCEILLNPLPSLGSFNIRVCFYANRNVVPVPITIYTEPL